MTRNNDMKINLAGMSIDDVNVEEEFQEKLSPQGYEPTKKGIAYKVFKVKNGKLYPPMVANHNNEDTPIGVWLDAEEGEFAGLSKTGRPQVKSTGSGNLSYRPGWHLGDVPRASQFDRTNKETGEKEFPKDFVWAECEYAMDVDYQPESDARGYERTKVDDQGNVVTYKSDKYQHSLAGVPHLPTNGYYKYRTNPNPDTVPWVITGQMKVKRLLSDEEVNNILKSKGIAPIHRQGGDKTLSELGLRESHKKFGYIKQNINESKESLKETTSYKLPRMIRTELKEDFGNFSSKEPWEVPWYRVYKSKYGVFSTDGNYGYGEGFTWATCDKDYLDFIDEGEKVAKLRLKPCKLLFYKHSNEEWKDLVDKYGNIGDNDEFDTINPTEYEASIMKQEGFDGFLDGGNIYINKNFLEVIDDDINLENESLEESAKTDFIDKFGQSTFNNFEKAKQRLVNKGYSVDYGQYLKKDKKEVDDLILSLYDDKKDAQKKRIIQGTDKEIRGKYRDLGVKNGFHIYEPLDVQASMDLGVNTSWCTTGRYGHYGHPELTPSLSDAREHWNEYTEEGVRLFYLLDPETMYGEYAIALYPKIFNGGEYYTYYISRTNVEIYNAKDDLDYSICSLPLSEMIEEYVLCEYEELEEVEIKDGVLVKYRGKGAHFDIPDGVTTIEEGAFSECSSLTSISIPDSVTTIGRCAFIGCSSLTSISIPNSVTSIGERAFSCCDSLTTVVIQNGVASIDWYAFYGCTSLTSITIPNSVTSIGNYAFQNCSSLTSINIPNSVTEIGSGAFYYCSELATITIPDSVTSIGSWAFECYPPLKVKTNNQYVMDYCNRNNIKVETVENLTESVEKHDTLNPKLFNEDNTIKEEVSNKLLEIANFFMDKAKEDGVEFDVKDILIVGSNANYNYTNESDIDLHIVVSKTPQCNKPEHLGIIYQAYKSMFNNKYDCTINGVPVEVYVEFEDEPTVEAPEEETSLEESTINPTTPYMLRNDGKLLECGIAHPYVKVSLEQGFEASYKEFKNHPQWIEWLIENSNQEEVKSLCKKEELTEEEFNKLNDLVNQEFCRVRTSNFKYQYGGNNGEIYFRISSKNFNWFDLIWQVVMSHKNSIKNVTVMKDSQSLGGKGFDYYVVDGKKLSHIDVEEFLTLKGNPVLEGE